jgi:DNA-binding MarR family transcriptional regulator
MAEQRPADPRIESVLFFRLEQTLRQATRYTHQLFGEAGVELTKDQWLILKKVSDEPTGVRPLELARVLGKETASVTRMLDILERKQLLERRPNPSDRRSYLVILTDAGRATFERVLPVVQTIRERAVRGFSKRELAELDWLLDKMRSNLA